MGIWKSNATWATQNKNEAEYQYKEQGQRQIPKGQMEGHHARILMTKREKRVEKKKT